jgi:hypothetical protein
VIQTTYAELLERSAAVAFSDAFPEHGNFTAKTVRGRRYWYFQATTPEGRIQRYAGPETPELLDRIAQHKRLLDDERERRSLVSTLTRSFALPSPLPEIGELIAALARAGVFRLRSVLIGTIAYQTYAGSLGLRLPGALLQTNDVDIAQFTSISVSLGDQTPPMLEVLRAVDKSFREIPHTADCRRSVSYQAKGGLRVDFLTPNEGPDTDEPQRLPALKTDAQTLRFLDFLIYEPTPAVVLHGPGIYVQVPAPERYAVHKLIVAVHRPPGIAKKDKDLTQAGTLLEALVQKRPTELQRAWEEAYQRGPKWRHYLLSGMSQLKPRPRDLTLKLLGRPRETLPGIDLTFNSPPARYDFDRDVVIFSGQSLGSPVECAVSREALEDYFGAANLDREGRVEAFRKNRSRIERLLRAKYLSSPVDEPESILLNTLDVGALLKKELQPT